MTYLTQLLSFTVLYLRFPQLNREYRSPLQLYGAAFAAVVFTLCLAGAIGFQQYVWQPWVGIIGYFAAAIAYYFLVARHNATLSPEEQFAMFMLYSIKFVTRKQKRLKKPRKQPESKASKLVSKETKEKSVHSPSKGSKNKDKVSQDKDIDDDEESGVEMQAISANKKSARSGEGAGTTGAATNATSAAAPPPTTTAAVASASAAGDALGSVAAPSGVVGVGTLPALAQEAVVPRSSDSSAPDSVTPAVRIPSTTANMTG